MKSFSKTDMAKLIALATNQYRMFIGRRIKMENKLGVIESEFNLEQRLDDYRKKLEADLDKKTNKLREDIAANKAEQARWIPEAVNDMLEGHSLEELFMFNYVESDGKRRLVVDFKYPDTVLPPEDEGPEYDGAGFCGSDRELAADMERAAQAEEIRAMKGCEEREMPDLRGTLIDHENGEKELVMTEEDMPTPDFDDEGIPSSDSFLDDVPEVNTIEEAKAMVDEYFAEPEQAEDFEEKRDGVAEAINGMMADTEFDKAVDEIEQMIDDPTVEEDDDDLWADDDDDSDSVNEDGTVEDSFLAF